jgi:hypothetical protein
MQKFGFLLLLLAILWSPTPAHAADIPDAQEVHSTRSAHSADLVVTAEMPALFSAALAPDSCPFLAGPMTETACLLWSDAGSGQHFHTILLPRSGANSSSLLKGGSAPSGVPKRGGARAKAAVKAAA